METILILLQDPATASGAGAVVGALSLLAIYFFVRKKSKFELPDEPPPQKTSAEVSQPDRSVEEDKPVASVEPAQAKRKDLREALSGTRSHIFGRIKERLVGQNLGSDDLESLEEILYTSDLGPQTVQRLVETVGDQLSGSEKSDVNSVQTAIKNEMSRIFTEVHQSLNADNILSSLSLGQAPGPEVLMIVGVNGAGKTTTIGKIAHHLTTSGKKVLLIAGDTFRAAAEEQLEVWSERAKGDIYNPENVKDPSAVAFEGLNRAKSGNYDVVIVDTAGRLHTQDHLMEELKKMKRVMQKQIPEAPHQVFIVLDANSGQNALIQAKNFNEALGLTGAVLTKLDGSAKGGVAVGLAYELSLPIRLIGVGEGIEDLRPFKPSEFVDSMI